MKPAEPAVKPTEAELIRTLVDELAMILAKRHFVTARLLELGCHVQERDSAPGTIDLRALFNLEVPARVGVAASKAHRGEVYYCACCGRALVEMDENRTEVGGEATDGALICCGCASLGDGTVSRGVL